MDTNLFIDTLRQDLLRAAEVGGAEMRAAAERLAPALDASLRLALFEALSQAAAEIAAQAPGLAIGVRLQGRDPVIVVEGAPAARAEGEIAAEAGEDDAVARITLRIPEALKARAEALAAGRGQSLNTWLVAAARAAAAADDDHPRHPHRHGRRVHGWAR